MNELGHKLAMGIDPLGNAYCENYSAKERRVMGVTLTPQRIVDWMISEAAKKCPRPARIVDAGAGTGRFALSAAAAFPGAEIIAIEKDSKLVAILRKNIRAAGLETRGRIVLEDFRNTQLDPASGPTIYLGNPPYVRHHDINSEWKIWYTHIMQSMGVQAGQLAGMHLHFFAKAIFEARSRDLVFFITAAEWLDVGYGSALRSLIQKRAERAEITVLNRSAQAFDDAFTTSALTLLEIGDSLVSLGIREIDTAQSLRSTHAFRKLSPAELHSAKRWGNLLVESEGAIATNKQIELGEFFAVHRGQVTGMNAVWTAAGYDQPLPDNVLFPTVTRARELLSLPAPFLESTTGLKRVVDLPEDLDALDQTCKSQVLRFLDWAKAQGAHNRYISAHRSPWYRVGLREPAPIVMTYMARRPPRFVRNLCGARLINIAHGLYPRAPLTDRLLDNLTDWLNKNISTRAGRTYAGGLTKFEPGEVMRLLIPPMEELSRNDAAR